MSSRRKASSKSRHDHSVPDGSSLQNNDVVPKVEFVVHSIDPEEADAKWAAMGEELPQWAYCHSEFLQSSEASRVLSAKDWRGSQISAEGYFTCYEAYLMQCHLWFLILEVITRLLNRFKLSIGQINPCALQHLFGILVLSYELGMNFDASHLDPC
ncbi:hypothetical protein Bca101_059653 [Brassica carinata]